MEDALPLEGSPTLPPRLAHSIQKAKSAWLSNDAIQELLLSPRTHGLYLSPEAPFQPAGGTLYLFDKKVCRYFRRDEHPWELKDDGKTLNETHERLKVGSTLALNCYYARSSKNDLKRRCYWLLDVPPGQPHYVLVHYLHAEGRARARAPRTARRRAARSRRSSEDDDEEEEEEVYEEEEEEEDDEEEGEEQGQGQGATQHKHATRRRQPPPRNAPQQPVASAQSATAATAAPGEQGVEAAGAHALGGPGGVEAAGVGTPPGRRLQRLFSPTRADRMFGRSDTFGMMPPGFDAQAAAALPSLQQQLQQQPAQVDLLLEQGQQELARLQAMQRPQPGPLFLSGLLVAQQVQVHQHQLAEAVGAPPPAPGLYVPPQPALQQGHLLPPQQHVPPHLNPHPHLGEVQLQHPGGGQVPHPSGESPPPPFASPDLSLDSIPEEVAALLDSPPRVKGHLSRNVSHNSNASSSAMPTSSFDGASDVGGLLVEQLDTDINSLPTPAEMRPAWGGAAAEAVDIDVGPLFFGGATAAPAAQAHPPHPPFQSGISAGVGGGSSAAVPSAASGGLHPPPSGTMVFVPGVPDGNSVQGPSARDALAGGFGSVLLAGSASSPIALAGSASSSLAGVGSGGSELAPRDNALGPASPPGQPLLHGGRPHSASHPRAAGQGHHGLGAASSADNRRSLGQEERKGAAAQAGQGARDGKLAAVRRERSSLAEEAEVDDENEDEEVEMIHHSAHPYFRLQSFEVVPAQREAAAAAAVAAAGAGREDEAAEGSAEVARGLFKKMSIKESEPAEAPASQA